MASHNAQDVKTMKVVELKKRGDAEVEQQGTDQPLKTSRAASPSPPLPAPAPSPSPLGRVCGYQTCKSTNATSSCGRCSKVFYCSKECQTAHWVQHKKQCLTEEETKLCKELKASTTTALKQCHVCSKTSISTGKPLKSCPCRAFRYCSSACQTEHWKNGHKAACAAKGKTKLPRPKTELTNSQRAIQEATVSLSRARKVGDRRAEADALEQIGIEYGPSKLGFNQESAKFCLQELTIRQEMADEDGVRRCYGRLGATYVRMSRFAEAKEFLEKELQIIKRTGATSAMAYSYQNHGEMFAGQGKYAEAVSHYEEALKLGRKLNDKQGQFLALSSLGGAYKMLKQSETSKLMHERQLHIAIEFKDDVMMCKTYCQLGAIHRQLGNVDKAIGFLEKGVAIASRGDRRGDMAAAYANLANCFAEIGRVQEALPLHEKSLNIGLELEDLYLIGMSYGNLSGDYEIMGQREKAVEFREKELALTKQIGDLDWESRSAFMMGQMLKNFGDNINTVNMYYAQSLMCSNKGKQRMEDIVKRGAQKFGKSTSEIKAVIESQFGIGRQT